MKKMSITALAILLGLAGAGEAVAQSGDPGPPTAILSTEGIVGKPVRNAHGQELGRISSLAMDLNTNQVAYAVLSPEGIQGVKGNRLVPWKAIRVDPRRDTFTLNMSPERLRKAPSEQSIAEREQEVRLYRYYGVTPYWGGPFRQTQPVPTPEEAGKLERPQPSMRPPNVNEPRNWE
ncbi:MAG: PRC-barrel domain-containing protein [Desulfobacteraceae bacterium]|nr:PRC-barrel domain-containing protein [Desulfobacteraceae bacterium]